MKSLRSMLQQRSRDITIGHVNSGPHRPFTEIEPEEENISKAGKCVSRQVHQEELEKMLADQFGDKLKPKKECKYKHKQPDFREMTRGKQEEKKKKQAPILESKLQPKHLTATRLKELATQGKTFDDIARLYNFTNNNYLRDTVKELGCKGLFKRGIPVKAG